MHRIVRRTAAAAAATLAATAAAVSLGTPAHAVAISQSTVYVTPTETQTSYVVMLDRNEKTKVAIYDAYWTGKVCSDITSGTGYDGNCKSMVQDCVWRLQNSTALPSIYLRPDGSYACGRY
jgi:hypothetical protein